MQPGTSSVHIFIQQRKPEAGYKPGALSYTNDPPGILLNTLQFLSGGCQIQ
jgi:hypothetical protein